MSKRNSFLYEDNHTREISFPLGGIGAGSIGLSGSGRLIDWEVFNRPNKGSTNGISHFAVRAVRDGAVLDARILNGPYFGNSTGDYAAEPSRSFGFGARRDSLAGMPHFAACKFDGRFPIAHLTFADDRFPGSVDLLAFNPFIPLADRESSMPAALFEITLRNTTDAPIDYTVASVLGHGFAPPSVATPAQADSVSGVTIRTVTVQPDAPEYAEFTLATDAPATSRQTYLYRGLWFDALEVYWQDLTRPGSFRDRHFAAVEHEGGMHRDRDSSLQAAHVTVPAGETRTVRFVIAWYAPNFCKFWTSQPWHFTRPSPASGTWKNWYATEWQGAEHIAQDVLANWAHLRSRTELFRDALYASTLPHAVLDAAAANLSILKTPTTVRLTDGTFYGWEGCGPQVGSCEGSCSHVWNYQQVLPFLFPALERSMRAADYRYNMNEIGGMSFRLSLPLGSHLSTESPCADGQFGNVMKLYRDWKLCGDDAWLARLWPHAKKSIEYAWHPANPDKWDPQQTGVLWGRQHHTLDMELFGPNAWLSGFYLGALKAGAEMAEHLGEPDTAMKYRTMFDSGRRWIDEHLFNAAYYIQQINLADRSQLDAYHSERRSRRLMGADVYDLYWSEEHAELKYQLGDGCIIDQLVAQWHANLYGLGEIFDPGNTVTALRTIYRLNFKQRLGDIYNPCRVFGMEDESGTVIAAWPDARKPAVPAPYAQETFHGMEYAFGGALLQYDLLYEGVSVFRAVRDRYNGANRNPWNEMECGSNYARSMASWCGILALSGFTFDANRHHIGFDPRVRDGVAFHSFWCNGMAWGTVTVEAETCNLCVLGGETPLASLGLKLPGSGAATMMHNSDAVPVDLQDDALRFAPLTLRAGDVMRIAAPALAIAHLPDAAML